MLSTLIFSLITFGNWALQTPILDSGQTKVDPAIVSVSTGEGRGTGFFIEFNSHRFLVTAAHVCGTSPILVSAKGLHRVLVSRPDKDICIATTYQNVKTLATGEEAAIGDAVEMTGFPGNLIYDYQKGTAGDVGISSFNLPKEFYNGCPALSAELLDGSCAVMVTTIQLKILARPGNSGGPVQNSKGEVVGILIGTDGKFGYMVPVRELLGLLRGEP